MLLSRVIRLLKFVSVRSVGLFISGLQRRFNDVDPRPKAADTIRTSESYPPCEMNRDAR